MRDSLLLELFEDILRCGGEVDMVVVVQKVRPRVSDVPFGLSRSSVAKFGGPVSVVGARS